MRHQFDLVIYLMYGLINLLFWGLIATGVYYLL